MTKKMVAGAVFASLAASASFGAAEDTNGDGMFSFEEMLVAYPTLTEETFIDIDANGDGGVDEAELASAVESGLLPAG